MMVMLVLLLAVVSSVDGAPLMVQGQRAVTHNNSRCKKGFVFFASSYLCIKSEQLVLLCGILFIPRETSL